VRHLNNISIEGIRYLPFSGYDTLFPFDHRS
jgi:hypothetical protein